MMPNCNQHAKRWGNFGIKGVAIHEFNFAVAGEIPLEINQSFLTKDTGK